MVPLQGGAVGEGGVDALGVGELEGLKAERWGKKSGGQKQQQAGAGQQALCGRQSGNGG